MEPSCNTVEAVQVFLAQTARNIAAEITGTIFSPSSLLNDVGLLKSPITTPTTTTTTSPLASPAVVTNLS